MARLYNDDNEICSFVQILLFLKQITSVGMTFMAADGIFRFLGTFDLLIHKLLWSLKLKGKRIERKQFVCV